MEYSADESNKTLYSVNVGHWDEVNVTKQGLVEMIFGKTTPVYQLVMKH